MIAPVANASRPTSTETRAPVEYVLRNDRYVTVAALVIIIGIAWTYTIVAAGSSMTMEISGAAAAGMAMGPMPWSLSYALLVLAMWWVMMIAMMVPGAAPMLLLFSAINRRKREGGRPHVPTGIFLGGYLAMWGAFSLLATLAHWGLESVGLLSASTARTGPILGGSILLAAGLYQIGPVKKVCLGHCQKPADFISRHWRPGASGAFRMGLAHGAYCLGCCWLLMALLFVGGVMSLYWIAGLALFVAVEKLMRNKPWISALSGAVLVASGAFVVIQPM